MYKRQRYHDETEEFPWDVYRKAAEVGLTCFDLPETFGGGGVESVPAQCLIGSVEHVRERLDAWRESGVTTLLAKARDLRTVRALAEAAE